MPVAALPGLAGRTATTGNAGKMFSAKGRKVQIFPFPSRFGEITKIQHFVMRRLTWYDSCLR